MGENQLGYCCKRIYRAGEIMGSRCSRPAKAIENGKPYCAIHTNEAEAKRREKRDARLKEHSAASDARYAAMRERERRADCYDDLMALAHAVAKALEEAKHPGSVESRLRDQALSLIEKDKS